MNAGGPNAPEIGHKATSELTDTTKCSEMPASLAKCKKLTLIPREISSIEAQNSQKKCTNLVR
jgi:hypothetical protein